MIEQAVRDFVLQETMPMPATRGTAVSLFSGAGLSDLGYQMAGFRFVVQVEADPRRAAVGSDNFPESEWLARDVRGSASEVAAAYRRSNSGRLDLLVATPPCQGMSTSNPSRGKRRAPQADALEEKNRLILEVAPIAQLLEPRVIVAENVRQILTLVVRRAGSKRMVIDALSDSLPNYQVFHGVVNVADYGVAQARKRALVVAVNKDEPWMEQIRQAGRLPWPSPTHRESPVSIKDWLMSVGYQPLDAGSKSDACGEDPLHYVPAYGEDRYQQVSQIPPHSGRSAYENDACPACGHCPVETGLASCSSCGDVMRNRPYVVRDGRARLIKGFHSSYRRMNSSRPASTITTNSSHVGSDFKIHPWENRVLSIRECADLQTVPRFYDWSRAKESGTRYLIRKLVGEAFPTYFTYLHGQVLADLLSNPEYSAYDSLALAPPR